MVLQKGALQQDGDCILNTSSINSYFCLEQKSLRAVGTWEQTRADSSSKSNGYSLFHCLPTAAGAQGRAVKHREKMEMW